MLGPRSGKRSRLDNASNRTHVLLLYNCYLDEDEVDASAVSVRRSVTRALGLENKGWPTFLNHLRFCTLREVGVPRKAGYDCCARVPAVLFSVLVLCEGECDLDWLSPMLCCPESDVNFARNGFRTSSVTRVWSDQLANIFRN